MKTSRGSEQPPSAKAEGVRLSCPAQGQQVIPPWPQSSQIRPSVLRDAARRKRNEASHWDSKVAVLRTISLTASRSSSSAVARSRVPADEKRKQGKQMHRCKAVSAEHNYEHPPACPTAVDPSKDRRPGPGACLVLHALTPQAERLRGYAPRRRTEVFNPVVVAARSLARE